MSTAAWQRRRSQAGQGAIEYLGLIVVSALIVLAIAAASGEIRTTASDALARAVCQLQSEEDCDNATADEAVIATDADVDPDAPRPELAEARNVAAPTTFAVATPGAGETCFASTGSDCFGPDDVPSEPGEIPEVPAPDPDVCEEGKEVGPDQFLKCDIDGLPILDLDFDGVNDFEDPSRTTGEGEFPWYEQGPTDFNENGIPDAEEPEAFTYRNPLFRPGQEGVYCEPGDEEGVLFCAPAPEELAGVVREQNSSLLGILERASWFVPIPGGVIAKVAGKLAGPIIKAAAGKGKTAVATIRSVLRRLGRAPAAPAVNLPDDVVKLARSNITDSGETVIGHYRVSGYPPYTEAARSRGASYFDLGKRYNELDEVQQKAANQLFLDDIIATGDKVTLSHPRRLVKEGSPLEWEIEYLLSKGYRQVDDTTLLPP